MPWEEEDASVRAAGGILQGKLLHPGGKQGMSTLGSGGNKGVQKVLRGSTLPGPYVDRSTQL